MYLGTVVGTVVSTQKNSTLVGFKLLLVQREGSDGRADGAPEVAVDTVGAGIGEQVIVTRGTSARVAAGQRDSAIDVAIVGIVDTLESEG